VVDAGERRLHGVIEVAVAVRAGEADCFELPRDDQLDVDPPDREPWPEGNRLEGDPDLGDPAASWAIVLAATRPGSLSKHMIPR